MILDVLRNPDTLISSVTGAYILAAASVWLKGANLGNLKNAQSSAINGIASKHENKDLVEVIQKITEEDPKLLMPPKRNRLLLYVSILALISAFFAIFHESFLKEYPGLEYYIAVVLALYIGLIIFGFYIMYNEYRYLAAIHNGKKQFEENGRKKMRVISTNN